MNVPEMGFYDPARGVIAAPVASEPKPHALVAFYRSYLTAADTGPVDALIAALRDKGFDAYGVFAASLKASGVADWLRAHLAQNPPVAIINATVTPARLGYAYSSHGVGGSLGFALAPLVSFGIGSAFGWRQWRKGSP